MENPLHGTWKLNVNRSVAEPGPLVQSEVRVYEAAGVDDLKLLVRGIDATGAAYSYGAIGRIDGTDCPLTGSGTRNGADSTSWTRIDSNTFDSIVKKASNVVNLVRLEVSMDGEVLTLREHGANSIGVATRGVRIYDKQG
jgi:hypothetical protein